MAYVQRKIEFIGTPDSNPETKPFWDGPSQQQVHRAYRRDQSPHRSERQRKRDQSDPEQHIERPEQAVGLRLRTPQTGQHHPDREAQRHTRNRPARQAGVDQRARLPSRLETTPAFV